MDALSCCLISKLNVFFLYVLVDTYSVYPRYDLSYDKSHRKQCSEAEAS